MAEAASQPDLGNSAVDSRRMPELFTWRAFLMLSKQIIMHWLNIFSYSFLKSDHGPYGETWQACVGTSTAQDLSCKTHLKCERGCVTRGL